MTESAALTVRLEAFEGPLDLLLHLCRTNELDLSRLPVRTITDQYLAYLESVEFGDLEAAGAFLVLAATLIYLKSKLLLPPGEEGEVLDEEAEPLREELEERLREYARVKALGVWLGEREAEQALIFGRPAGELPSAQEIPLDELSVHLLERAYRRLREEALRQAPREIEPSPLSVLERMGEILSLLRHTWSLLFSAVVGGGPLRSEVVVTFLALLELVRLGQARVWQREPFGEIVIERNTPEAPHAPAS